MLCYSLSIDEMRAFCQVPTAAIHCSKTFVFSLRVQSTSRFSNFNFNKLIATFRWDRTKKKFQKLIRDIRDNYLKKLSKQLSNFVRCGCMQTNGDGCCDNIVLLAYGHFAQTLKWLHSHGWYGCFVRKKHSKLTHIISFVFHLSGVSFLFEFPFVCLSNWRNTFT